MDQSVRFRCVRDVLVCFFTIFCVCVCVFFLCHNFTLCMPFFKYPWFFFCFLHPCVYSPPPRVCLCACNPVCAFESMEESEGVKKNEQNFDSFNVRSRQKAIFSTCLLMNDSSKKNVYFNIYLLQDLYILVIYNWINFICCET